MRISVSSPYRENAIVNITRALAVTGRLQRFYTTLYLAQWERTAKRVPLLGNRLARELRRRGFLGPCLPVARTGTPCAGIGHDGAVGRIHATA